MIAVVEDARAAQEREAERLRDKLSGLGKTLTPLAPRTNGAASASASASNGGTLRDYANEDEDEGGRDDLVDSAEVSLANGCSPLGLASPVGRSIGRRRSEPFVVVRVGRVLPSWSFPCYRRGIGRPSVSSLAELLG